jgi:hypothetical protein
VSDEISRRDFVKQAAASAAILSGVSGASTLAAAAQAPVDPSKRIVAALGPVFIPSKVGDPGYANLEAQGISDFVLQKLPADSLDDFNTGAKPFFGGKEFVDLTEAQREEYVGIIADGSKITDPETKVRLQSFYRAARNQILTVYYKNFPLEEFLVDAQGLPKTQPGDRHQVTNPNVWKDKKLVTGWDIAGYGGQMGWDEEIKVREKAKRVSMLWYEGASAKLSPSRPSPAVAGKTTDGHDYYDVIVLGGGTAGCIVAGRLAERGMNPKTGDKLRVALIEGGDDWTIRDPGLNPGYGNPIRRLMTSLPDPTWNYPLVEGDANIKLLGGCVLHYGGTLWMPGEDDFRFYRETSGVNWDAAKFGTSIQEVTDMMYLQATPDEWWSKGDHLWANAGRVLTATHSRGWRKETDTTPRATHSPGRISASTMASRSSPTPTSTRSSSISPLEAVPSPSGLYTKTRRVTCIRSARLVSSSPPAPSGVQCCVIAPATAQGNYSGTNWWSKIRTLGRTSPATATSSPQLTCLSRSTSLAEIPTSPMKPCGPPPRHAPGRPTTFAFTPAILRPFQVS